MAGGAISRRRVLSLSRSYALAGGAFGLFSTGALLASSPARAATPDPVRIINTAGTFGATMHELMKQQAYLEQFGLAPTFLDVADGTRILGALLSGESDICIASGFGQVLPAIERGGKLKIIAGAEVLLLHLVYSGKPEIRTLKDLEGHTVGTGSPGALLHSIMVAILTRNNVDVSKVTFVNVGSSADVFRAVAAKKVDAGPAELDYQGEEERFGVHSLVGGKFWSGLPEYTNQGTYVSDAAIQSKRDILIRTLAAYAKLYRFISGPQSKDAYVSARAAAVGKSEPEEATAQWDFFQTHRSFDVDLTLSDDRLNYMQNLNLELGLQKVRMPVSQFADMSLARDAIKLLN